MVALLSLSTQSSWFPVLRPSVSRTPSPHTHTHHLTEDGPSVTSSQPSLKAAVDKGGDIKVTPDDSEHLSSSFRLLAAEFFPSFLSALFFFYFISAAFSPFRPPSVFNRHPPLSFSVYQSGDHHSGSIDLLGCELRTQNCRQGGSRERGRRGGE